jgi:hypothetical protein
MGVSYSGNDGTSLAGVLGVICIKNIEIGWEPWDSLPVLERAHPRYRGSAVFVGLLGQDPVRDPDLGAPLA